MPGRPPQTFEEDIVAYLEKEAKCVKEVVIPPPDSCPQSVHIMYGLAKWHVLTVVIILVFVMIIGQMINMAYHDH